MKLLSLVLICAFAFSATAANQCPAKEDILSCTVTYGDGSGKVANQNFDITVYSSTFLCDGRSNRFFSNEYALGTDHVAFVYASYEAVAYRIFKTSDTDRLREISSLNAQRGSGVGPHSAQSLYLALPNDQFGQVLCETLKRGR